MAKSSSKGSRSADQCSRNQFSIAKRFVIGLRRASSEIHGWSSISTDPYAYCSPWCNGILTDNHKTNPVIRATKLTASNWTIFSFILLVYLLSFYRATFEQLICSCYLLEQWVHWLLPKTLPYHQPYLILREPLGRMCTVQAFVRDLVALLLPLQFATSSQQDD